MNPQANTTGALDIIRRSGSTSWAVVGIVAVLTLLLIALASISEVVLPLFFAAVLAVIFAPMAERLRLRGLRNSLAALAVVVLILVATVGTVVFTLGAVIDELDTLDFHVDRAVNEVAQETDAVGVDTGKLEQVRGAVNSAAPLIAAGFATLLLSGVGTLVGFVAGAILGVLILYYLLKDHAAWRERIIALWPVEVRPDVAAFVARSTATMRAYAAGRAVLSAAIALIITAWSALLGLPMLGAIAVVNFIGGFVPYIGAIVGGSLAVILALSEHGVGLATATLAVLLIANFAIENLLEPYVLGGRLHLHPMLVLVITMLGGILGGVVGLMLGVPLFMVGSDAVRTAWRRTRGLGDSLLQAVGGAVDTTPAPTDAAPAASETVGSELR